MRQRLLPWRGGGRHLDVQVRSLVSEHGASDNVCVFEEAWKSKEAPYGWFVGRQSSRPRPRAFALEPSARPSQAQPRRQPEWRLGPNPCRLFGRRVLFPLVSIGLWAQLVLVAAFWVCLLREGDGEDRKRRRRGRRKWQPRKTKVAAKVRYPVGVRGVQPAARGGGRIRRLACLAPPT